MRRPPRLAILWARLVWVPLLALSGPAAPVAGEPAGARGGVVFSRAADHLVARLAIFSGERAEREARRVSVYGDGRVLASFPQPLRRAGRHQARLSPAELDGLVAQLVASGLQGFDAAAVRASCRALAASRGEVHAVADADVIEIELYLDVPALERRVVWRGLTQDRRRFPGVAELAGLEAARDALAALLAREDLEAVP